MPTENMAAAEFVAPSARCHERAEQRPASAMPCAGMSDMGF
jgi:hypothetical protein